LPLGLVKRRLKRTWVNLKKKLTLPDERALLVTLLQKVSCDLRSNIGVHESVESADPLPINGNIFSLDLDHFDIWRGACHRTRGVLGWANSSDDQPNHDQAKESANYKFAFRDIDHAHSPAACSPIWRSSLSLLQPANAHVSLKALTRQLKAMTSVDKNREHTLEEEPLSNTFDEKPYATDSKQVPCH
jgi:hypothetical protein